MNTIDTSRIFYPLNIAVLTVSDTRKADDDRSGQLLEQRILQAGHKVIVRSIVRDEIAAIRTKVNHWLTAKKPHILITTGGTGFTGRDLTPEAIEPLFDKTMDGFSVLFHHVSQQTVGIATMQSRATAGLVGETFVFCLPGSTGACKDAWDNILKAAFDSRQRPSNLVDLMPRLAER